MLKKIGDLTILGLLIVLIFYLGNTGQMKLLINPRFYNFIYIALIIIFVMFCYILITPATKGEAPTISRYILFLCLIFMGFSISYKDFQKNISGVKPVDLNISKLNLNKKVEKEVIDYSKLDSIEINDNNFLEVIDAMYRDLDLFIGKRVTISGYIYRPTWLEEESFIISRLIMICCAADTSLYGLLSSYSGDFIFQENGWYKISGVLGSKEILEGGMKGVHPHIQVTEYESIPIPDDPYLYPDLF